VREPAPVQRLRSGSASPDWEIIRELDDGGEGRPFAEALTMIYATTQLERARPPA